MVLVFLLFKFNAGMEHSDAGMIKVGNNILTDFFFRWIEPNDTGPNNV